MEIEKLAEEARNSISDYCINECKGQCCKGGEIVISHDELMEIHKTKQINKKQIRKNKQGQYLLNLRMKCPALKEDRLCSIHKSKLRPNTCADFPIFVNREKKQIHIHQRCIAAFENKLLPFIMQVSRMGYKIIDGR